MTRCQQGHVTVSMKCCCVAISEPAAAYLTRRLHRLSSTGGIFSTTSSATIPASAKSDGNTGQESIIMTTIVGIRVWQLSWRHLQGDALYCCYCLQRLDKLCRCRRQHQSQQKGVTATRGACDCVYMYNKTVPAAGNYTNLSLTEGIRLL